MKISRRITTIILSIVVGACAPAPEPVDEPAPASEARLDEIAVRYVRLVLGVGEHDEGYVDAYYGPAAWREEVAAKPPEPEALHAESRDLLAAEYAEVRDLMDGLDYADVEAARRYLDGEIDADEAASWIRAYRLYSEDRARQRVRFYDTYRSYVINYSWGEDQVRRYVEARGGTADQPARRWEVFADLLAFPRLPSALMAEIE